jgi:hypothetical protein
MIASGEAYAGDSPAVCTTSVTAPRSLAVAARSWTDSWEATSTVAVLVVHPRIARSPRPTLLRAG